MIEEMLEEKINFIIEKFETRAVIFDLDGTLIDNNSFHLQTWKKYLEKSGRSVSDEEFNANFNGRTNEDVVEYIYGKNLTKEEVLKHSFDKEALYREIYQPFIKPVKGLIQLLELLQRKNIPMAIATSGIQPNIDFMFEHIPIKKYFKTVVNSSLIKKGKPDPEIYIKTASVLGILPENCLVFEDAVVGINSAKAAGMKVIAVATTHSREELTDADMIIDNYYF
ncbi:MAG: HAD family phosphatase [Bacteroidota bacterium]|nr:HAD family phosphatase [Bacteroidota bacterium]